jgi:hypothetical protein
MRFTFNDFYKLDKGNQKEKLIQKVKNQKERVAEVRINELCTVTKYAHRFNIKDSICRQIIKETKY